ncbi:MAG: pilus assembly protein [Planctomycetes bacterium]|nr:pilus assembly protein [Planctomycetota bacterium]
MTENEKDRIVRAGLGNLRAAVTAALVITAVAAGLFLLAGGWRVFSGGSWLAAAMGGRIMLICGLAMLASVIGLSVIACFLWKAGKAARGRDRAEEGTAMLEFAMVLPFALMLFLVMAQSSMLMGGNLGVNYSAYCAARTAIVKIPMEIDPEAANQISDLEEPTVSGKLMQIWSSAVFAVLPMADGSYDAASGDGGVLRDGLRQLFSAYDSTPPGWLDGRLEKKLGYAQNYTSVRLNAPSSGDTYTEHEDITVFVTHTLYMAVPYADTIFDFLGGDDGVDLYNGRHGMIMRATCTLPNEGVRDYIDVEMF